MFSTLADEYSALEKTIVLTPARTVDGALAKLRFTLRTDSFDTEEFHRAAGTRAGLPVSAMRDALRMLGG